MGRQAGPYFAARLSDEELEYYGELYAVQDIRSAGIEFEVFLSNPDYYIRKYGRSTPPPRDRRRSWWRAIRRLFGGRSAREPA
jgi:hypothetical protein